MYLRSLRLKGFKNIADLAIEPERLVCLVGGNNSGKSSFLQGIHFCVAACRATALAQRIEWKRDTFRTTLSSNDILYSPASRLGSLVNVSGAEAVELHVASASGDVSVSLKIDRDIEMRVEGRTLGEQLISFERPFTVYVPGLAGLASRERFVGMGVLRRMVARGDANLVLRNVLYSLSRDVSAWERFRGHLDSIFPGVDIDVRYDEASDEYVEALIIDQCGVRMPLEGAGLGVLKACQILSYVELFRPHLLILDEPDAHLHPNNQRRLVGLIRSVSEENGFQTIVASHSRHVIDTMIGKKSLVWVDQGRRVEYEDSEVAKGLLSLGALDSLDYFLTGGARCVVLTEDDDTSAIEALVFSNGFVPKETEIRSYSGCSKVEGAAVLARYLMDKAPDVQIVLHRDRDFLSDEELASFTERIEQLGVECFITHGNDVESYFLNVKHLAALNPGVSEERIEQLLAQCIEQSRDRCLEKLVNARVDAIYKSGRRPSAGKVAVEATALLESSPKEYSHGKIVLRRLKGLIWSEAGSARIFEPSPFLSCHALCQISQRIWPDCSHT